MVATKLRRARGKPRFVMASAEQNQSEVPTPNDAPPQNGIPLVQFSEKPSLEEIRSQMQEFASERDWNQYHTPRNVLLALVGEVGELSEIFQWRGEVSAGLPGWSAADRTRLEHELSDVLLYLVRLSNVCGVDLPAAAARQMAHNAAKYPAERVRGDSRKYDQYDEYTRERETPDGEESS
ncbi:dCTP pyrophosphatase 1-like isoform X2 [Amphibalanus amphitrite]|uniref:dCTP pyrophosphatase 1-like isoform X2 n=1 Tax=Amphibalanus amphitrite TaxID=1232801 RepID=UPI001C911C3C|nr:dCTP pyrophosphatase 1-like isoform X2 [Amphibalanus amphitrite]